MRSLFGWAVCCALVTTGGGRAVHRDAGVGPRAGGR